MAEIPIERKTGTNWLPWVIGLVLLALLLWWLLSRMGDPEPVVPVATTPDVVAPAAAPAGVITDWSMLTGDAAALVGRQVALTSVPVQSVVSDRGFWIGPSEGERVFAIRTNQSAPVTPPDGAVNTGQTVSVFGTVQAMPADLTQQATDWNLQSTDVSLLSQQSMYIAADSVRILQTP